MSSSDPLPALLTPFLEHPEQAGVLVDFDGTLAPIVQDPAAARPLPEAGDVLHRLAHRYRRVAVISGRPAAFLAEHLRPEPCVDEADCPGEGLLASGLYGLEMADGDAVTSNPVADDWRQLVKRVAARAEEEAPAGVLVERKGLSVVLHYRTAPGQADWVTRWVDEHAESTGLVRHPARMSEELRPPLDVDKGTVVGELAAGLDAVCFLGDDSGDLPAFAVLDRLARDEGVTTLKVVAGSDETPPEVREAADVVVDGPEGALELLDRLVGG